MLTHHIKKINKIKIRFWVEKISLTVERTDGRDPGTAIN